jgi:predicted RNase H-like HicB family nuclease
MKKQVKNKTFLRSVMTYPVIVHEDNESGGYWVECSAFQGCYSQGKTIEDCLVNIKEAIFLCAKEEPNLIKGFIKKSVSA